MEPKQDCPHVHHQVRLRPDRLKMDAACKDCGCAQENWICLQCYQVRGSRYTCGHAVAHWTSTRDEDLPVTDPDAAGHCIALSLTDLSVWCHACDSYIKHHLLHPILTAAEALKFGKPRQATVLEPQAFHTAYYHNALSASHAPAFAACLERPRRVAAVQQWLEARSLVAQCRAVIGRAATVAELELVHTPAHVQRVLAVRDSAEAREALSGADVYVTPDSGAAAAQACGGLVEVVAHVLQREARNGLALLRPPGHHCGPAGAAGFCLLNNVAVAAAVARRQFGLKRIAIVDWDLHHGDGTQAIFYDDPEVLYISLHRHEHSPGKFYCSSSSNAQDGAVTGGVASAGSGPGEGYNINVPLPFSEAGYGDADYQLLFDGVVIPVLRQYQPELVLVSAGFDAARDDPTGADGGFALTPAGFAQLTQGVLSAAQGRLVLALEGGYGPLMPECVEACLRVLLGESPPPLPSSIVRPDTLRVAREVRGRHAKWWPCFRDGANARADTVQEEEEEEEDDE